MIEEHIPSKLFVLTLFFLRKTVRFIRIRIIVSNHQSTATSLCIRERRWYLVMELVLKRELILGNLFFPSQIHGLATIGQNGVESKEVSSRYIYTKQPCNWNAEWISLNETLSCENTVNTLTWITRSTDSFVRFQKIWKSKVSLVNSETTKC